MPSIRVTTDQTLVRDLTRSLVTRGVCPIHPTLGEWLAAVYAHGVTLNDTLVAIDYQCRTGAIVVTREPGDAVRIGEAE